MDFWLEAVQHPRFIVILSIIHLLANILYPAQKKNWDYFLKKICQHVNSETKGNLPKFKTFQYLNSVS